MSDFILFTTTNGTSLVAVTIRVGSSTEKALTLTPNALASPDPGKSLDVVGREILNVTQVSSESTVMRPEGARVMKD